MGWNCILQEKFAYRLKLLMMMHKDSNDTVAKWLGCSRERISNLRCCASKPTDKEVEVIAAHYDVPVSFMSGDSKLILITEDRGGNQQLIYKEVI
jgi:hypothetical protein